ncbi:MAG: hypothetical protein K0Q63_3547 [Paenibacillus sp.]|nr:hypothetical protein [Paenibacillus sp.]
MHTPDMLMNAILLRWYYSSDKKNFMLPVDQYEHWAILAADEGSFRYRVGEETGTAKFGDIVVCPPGYRLHRTADEPLSFLFIEFQWPGPRSANEPSPEFALPCGKVAFHRMDRYASIFALIRGLADVDLQEAASFKQHLLRDLLFLFALQRREATSRLTSNDPVVRQAVRHIRLHAFEPLSLKLLADEAALSQSQFSRRFQAGTGMSPIAFLTDIRMKRAQQLLLGTELTIDEIARQCGYQNGFYLSRVFKSHCGATPSSFRRTYRI